MVAIFSEQFAKMLPCRMRRRLARGLKRKHLGLLSRLNKAKKAASVLEKPACVKTHLRDMIILPEMVGAVVGVYNGKIFNQVSVSLISRSDWLDIFLIGGFH